LEARLTKHEAAPVLIGFSGGGDSLALLLMAYDWAAKAGRRLIAVSVDHQLRPEGEAWAKWCEARCARLGVTHLTRVWRGPKPRTGLAAAARDARHLILAEAGRAFGARVILLGHTADDVLEAAWMQSQGLRTPAPRAWAPSPIWPGGRDQFLLRPLLGARRRDLRLWLDGMGETWIDDPGNDDPTSARIRARRAMGLGAVVSPSPSTPSPGPPPFREGQAGELIGRTSDLREADEATARLWLGAALACVGGAATTPPRKGLDRLLRRLKAGAPLAATLAGARLIGDGETVILARETGDRRAGRVASLSLDPGATAVWDGRFEVMARSPGWSVGHLAGRARRLDRQSSQSLRELPPAARRGVPALLGPAGEVVCPTLRRSDAGDARSLVMRRLSARCGAIQHESDIAAWRNG
jgi:tRNA(Ile)-lysidine synthase